jgi:hypothetical protein
MDTAWKVGVGRRANFISILYSNSRYPFSFPYSFSFIPILIPILILIFFHSHSHSHTHSHFLSYPFSFSLALDLKYINKRIFKNKTTTEGQQYAKNTLLLRSTSWRCLLHFRQTIRIYPFRYYIYPFNLKDVPQQSLKNEACFLLLPLTPILKS